MTWTTPRPSAPRTARRTALRAGASVAVLASGALLLLTACSSSSSPKASSSVAPSASSGANGTNGNDGKNAQAMTAYRDCLSQHGVKLPSFTPRSPGAGRPSGRPSGTGRRGGGGYGGFGGFGGASADPATQKAMQACASLRPQFNGQRGGGGNSTAFKAFTSCLKDHGVVLPTPSAGATGASGGNGGGGYGGFGALRGINTSDPKTAKAYDTCKALLPQRPSGRPSSSASPSAS